MGRTLLRHLLQREHCVTLSTWCCRMPANHGRTRHRANFGGAQQGHRQLGLWQGPWQWRDPPRPTKALQDHLTAFSACTPLSVLARWSCTTRHAGRQDHDTLKEQGREEWLQQLQRHLRSQHHWQSLCKGHLDPTAEAGRTCLSWITVWLPSWKVNNRHGLLLSPIPGEVQRTTDAPVYRFHWPHKGVWSCQQRRSLPDPPKDWLPTKIAEHDRILPHKHERGSAVQRQLLQALWHPQRRQTRLRHSPDALWNLLCPALETRLWHSIRGNLSTDQTRWQTFQSWQLQNQDKGSGSPHQRHAVQERCSCDDPHPAGPAGTDGPLLSGLQGFRTNHQSEEDKRPGAGYHGTAITIDDYELDVVEQFTYHGSTITDNLSLDTEIDKRIGKAATTLARLTSRVWTNPKLTVKTKMVVYNASVVSILMYGSEKWTKDARQEKRLNSFHMSSIRRILCISWQDRVSNTEVPSRANLPSMFTLLRQRRLRWLGHVYRMEDGRIPKDILYGELASGRKTKGRPQLRYKDVCKRDMKALDINTNSWEDLATDRMMWRSTLNQHLKTGEKKPVNAEAGRRARRKERNNSNRPETTHMRILWQRLFLPHRSLQPQATLQQSNRLDNQDVLPWSNLIEGGHIEQCSWIGLKVTKSAESKRC